MSKTAMQELWEYIDANIHEEGFNLYAAKELSLEKEKEGIICAWNDSKVSMMSGEQYFEETYNQSK